MSAYTESVLGTAGLVSFWELGEEIGSASDLKGTNTGAYEGSPLRGQAPIIPGARGKCVDLTPSTQYVAAPSAASLNLGDTFSIEAWVKPRTLEANRAILGKGTGAYYLRIGSGGKVELIGGSGFKTICQSKITLAVNTVYHIVATKSGATSKIWINGVESVESVNAVTCENNTNALNIGRESSFTSQAWDGKLQYVALYSTAISEASVKAHYEAGQVSWIGEQLKAAPVTDSLKHAAIPSETEWPKLAWSTGRGTDSESGWKPESYTLHEPDGSKSGWRYKPLKLVGGNAYAQLQSPTFGTLQGGAGAEFRQRSLWLFTTGEGTANGYQLTCKDTASGTSTKYVMRLSKFVSGERLSLATEVEVEIEANGAIAITASNGVVSGWVRKTETSNWVEVVKGASGTFTEGYSAVDGNGSNPTFINFKTGLLNKNVEGAVANLSGLGAVSAKGTATRFGTSPLSGLGSLLVAGGTRTRMGAAQLTGLGTLVAVGSATRFGSKALLSGVGSLSGSGEVELGELRRNKVYPDRRPRHVRYAIELEIGTTKVIVGPDEAEAANVPIQVEFDTEMPGGFGPGQVTMPEPEGVESTQARLFSGLRIYDADTGRNFYEGRITSVSFSSGQVSLETEGWSKHLEDDSSASMIFYDRDLSGWANGPSVKRDIYLTESGFNCTSATVKADVEAPALENAVDGAWSASPGLPRSNGWYDAGAGNKIAYIDYAWKRNANVSAADANWSWEVFASIDDVNKEKPYDTTGNLRAAGPGSGTLTTTEGNRRYANAQLAYSSGPAGTQGVTYAIYWTLLAVVGNHGIPLQGTVAVPGQGRGVLGSDVASYTVGRWSPLLQFSTGPNGSIEPTTFVIPHFAYKEDTTAKTIIEALSLLGGSYSLPLDWGVYDERTFFMRAPKTYGRIWRVRRDQATESDNSGPDASERLNGVIVNYDDGTGKKFSIGPVGSGCDKETPLLEDTDPTNPANQDGARHWKQYDGEITSELGAEIIGLLVLANANNIQWRGDINVTGELQDSTGAWFPAASVRGGDYAVVEDDPDTRLRRIVNTGLSEQSVRASCGTPPDQLDVLLARNGVVLVGRV